jgi:phage replication initiation protein
MKKSNVLPPYTNRGVENTTENGLRACVDWLQVTFKNLQSPEQVTQILGLDFSDFIHFESGKYGYAFHYRFGHIAIYYSYEISHLHLEITGQGCRELEQLSPHSWIELLGLILMLDVNITRLDFAIDDIKGYFTFKQLIRKIKNGHVRSRFKKARVFEDVVLNDGSTAGTTIYFGSAKSDILVRIYDKFQERLSAGKEIESGIDVWNRVEIQLRDDRAKIAAFELVHNFDTIGEIVQRILRNYVLFCDPKKNDTNKSRWPISAFWIKFLDNVQPLKLTKVAPDMTVEKVKNWFEKSVVANFALLVEAFDGNEDLISEWIKKGKEKQKKKHENMLKRYLKEQKLMNEIVEEKKKRVKNKLLEPRFLFKEIEKVTSWDEVTRG